MESFADCEVLLSWRLQQLTVGRICGSGVVMTEYVVVRGSLPLRVAHILFPRAGPEGLK